MERRRIGSLEVSVIGLGGNNFGRPQHRGGPVVGSLEGDLERTTEVVRAALDAGINFIDTAEEYALGESEEFIGKALGRRHDEVVIATKFNSGMSPTPGRGAGEERIMRSVEDSLRRLGTDRIDLYQIHQPDPETPVEETLAALDRLLAQGKVREVGCCNFTAPLLDEAAEVADAKGLMRFASLQTSYSIMSRGKTEALLPALERNHVRLIPYWPLGGGILTGKYRRGEKPGDDTRLAARSEGEQAHLLRESVFDRVEPLEEFARSRGRTVVELALSWLVAQRSVATVIVGATSAAQVTQNATAGGWRLSPEDLAELDELTLRPAG